MTSLGTVLGTAAFVSTLGLTSTVQQQVSAAFDVRRATEVIVRPQEAGLPSTWQRPPALERLRRLKGVDAAGRRIVLGELPVTRSLQASARATRVTGVDPQALAVIKPRITTGRFYDAFHEHHAARVVLLPLSVAASLSITRIGVAVFIQDQAFTVMGIYDDVTRRPETLLSAVIPATTAEKIAGSLQLDAERDVVIATLSGAAQVVGQQAALALLPESPSALRTITPPDPRTLRREIEGDVTRSTLLLSIIVLVIGAVSIGNAATAAIASRTGEIGLRRAVGGRPAHIFAQLLAETTTLGALGGSVGALCGLAITSAVSLWQSWTPVIDIRLAMLASVVGASVGALAGLWPATRAMRIHPIAALQR